MAKQISSDRVLFGVTLTLVVVGLVMVFSSSAALAAERFDSAYTFFWRQLGWAALGGVALFVLMRVDYRRLRHPAILFPGIFLALAMLAGVLLTEAHQQTNRWLRWGVLSFQPSELAKLVVVVFLAFWLERRSEKINDVLRTRLPAAALVGLVIVLILCELDLGTPILIGLTACAMFYLAGLRLSYFVYVALATVPALYWLIFSVAYRRHRVLSFLNPYADPQGTGFQIIQSLIAVGTGGVTGLGLMNGKQKMFFLPAPHTDFIYAVAAEELGLWGATLLLALFGLYFWRGWRASLHAPDAFGRYLAAGLTLAIVGQALMNISVVLGMVPPKGVPLPFISYGGSSLFCNLAATGILLNISQHAEWGRKARSLEVAP